jgi:hypothetical protein
LIGATFIYDYSGSIQISELIFSQIERVVLKVSAQKVLKVLL